MTTNGVVTLYTIPRLASEPFRTPQYITRRGGAMWYTDVAYRLGRITTSGVITQYVHQAGVNPWGIALGADNNLWFTAYFSDTINRFRVSDTNTTTWQLDNLASPALATLGPDDAVWFTQLQAGKIGRITTNGVLTETFVGQRGPYGICTGADGAVWFAEHRRATNSIGRLTVDGELSRYGLAVFSDVSEIATGQDGGLWFTMPGRDRIGRIRYTTSGNVVLTGALNDPGSADTHVAQINWGDGTAVDTVNLAAGIASFTVAHTYAGSQTTNYTINVTATDDDTGTSSASAQLTSYVLLLKSVKRLANGDVRLSGVGGNGRTVTIEATSDFVTWSTVGTVNSVSNKWEFVHSNPSSPRLSYRGKLP